MDPSHFTVKSFSPIHSSSTSIFLEFPITIGKNTSKFFLILDFKFVSTYLYLCGSFDICCLAIELIKLHFRICSLSLTFKGCAEDVDVNCLDNCYTLILLRSLSFYLFADLGIPLMRQLARTMKFRRLRPVQIERDLDVVQAIE